MQLIEIRLQRCLDRAEASATDADKQAWTDEALAAFAELESLSRPAEPYSAVVISFIADLRNRLSVELL
ncbi:MAG: hypothetical protein IPO30_20545 [Hyphomonadaceae bacterium]|nr:hypothetical protein [Hyphomonadaceae bacterium]